MRQVNQNGASMPEGNHSGPHLASALRARLAFGSIQILEHVDSARRHRLTLDPAFPLALNFFEFPAVPGAVPLTWHERLEIFCALSGSGTFRIGENEVAFKESDILLIDNLRLHGVGRFEGPSRRALVVVFYPELVAAPGALPCDLWLLRPFRHLRDGCLQLRSGDAMAAAAWDCVNKLVLAWVDGTSNAESQARKKALLIDLLICLGEAFRPNLGEQSDYESRCARLRRLTPLFDHLAEQGKELPSIAAAARMVTMSGSYFMRFFKSATGLTFSAYVDQLRASRAHQLLLESELTLAEIAAETGFCDQCHMSRHLQRRFGLPPGRIRSMARAIAAQEAGTGPAQAGRRPL
jgi:AraC-like DNA-binding protein